MWMGAGVDEDDKLDRDAAKTILRRTYGMLRPHRRRMVVAGVLAALFTMGTLAGPLLVRTGIDDGIKVGDRTVINQVVVAYVVIAVLSYFVYRAQVVTISRLGEDFLKALRLRLFDHLQKLSMPFYDREKAGVVVSRMTSDIDSLSELVQMGLLMFVSNALLLAVSVVVLGVVSWKLLLLCLLALPPVILASRKFQRDSNVAYLDVRDGIGATLSQLQEGISGVRVVQAFAREDIESTRFERRNRRLFDAHMKSVRISAWYLPVIEIAGLGTTAAAVGVGGWWVHQGDLTIGTVTFFVLTLSNLFEPIQQLSQLFNMVQSAGAGLKKVYELLDTDVDVPERPGAVDLPGAPDVGREPTRARRPQQPGAPGVGGSASADVGREPTRARRPQQLGSIEVHDLAFSYLDGTEVLSGVDLTIAAGERIALVGPTGAGKSTLAKLIARFYDPTAGSITIGGVDLRDATHASLRRTMVVVPQEGFLFNGTLVDNIRLARPEATDDEVAAAMESIGILDRFADLPEGLHTEVRERGSRFSAGEKQLVSLGRAALAAPEILVLDEATSSLDPGTEAVVEEAMERLAAGRTTIVIAHRLTTAARADRVAVVAEGRLAEVGTHDELIAADGHYAALFAAWAGGQPV